MPPKELHYYDSRWGGRVNRKWYSGHFNAPGMLLGEKTPEYMMQLHYINRMKHITPNAKIIVSLRNPVDRVVSMWRIDKGMRKRPLADVVYDNDMLNLLLWRGLYAGQVRWLFDAFGRENVLVLIFERWTRDMNSALNHICKFLDVKPWTFPEPHLHSSPKQPAPQDVVLDLVEYYKPWNESLFALLEDDILEWENPTCL